MMLLCNLTELISPGKETGGNKMGKSSNSQNNRAMLEKNEQSEIFSGVKSNIKQFAGLTGEPADSRPNQDIGKIVTF